MHRVLAIACVIAALRIDFAFAQPADDPNRQPFSKSDLLAGKKMTEAECAALPTAVWLSGPGSGACIRYYLSTAGGEGKEPIVYLSEDAVLMNGRREAQPLEPYLRSTPASMQTASANWSRGLSFPYLFLGRPGTYGSSGEQAKRRTPQEITQVSAALDAIKARHGYTRLHIVGYGQAGHAAAVLLARRNDVGCVVLSSALVSVRIRLAELAMVEDDTGNKNPVDPIVLVGQIHKQPHLRIFVVTDPDDMVISARSQTAYVKQLLAAGLPVNQIFAAASDVGAHGLWREAREVAADCARGMTSEAMVAKYENKKPQIPPDAFDPPLHRPDMRDVAVSEAQCKDFATALWLRIDGRSFCVRYWISTAGGDEKDALLFIPGDLGHYKGSRLELHHSNVPTTSGSVQRNAHFFSRLYKGPYIYLSRLGTYGSSGDHSMRRSHIEVRVAMAAVDALKERYGFRRFHAVGQSGGAHTVIAMTQQRNDLGCVVSTSGVLAHKAHQRDNGGTISPKVRSDYDPVDFVSAMRHQEGRRIVVMSDSDDRVVSFRSQREFVDRVKARGLPILHVLAAAPDGNFHELGVQGRLLAIDCAANVYDEALVAKYQNKTAPGDKRVKTAKP